MITPLDIENKEFKKTFRGYNAKNVDEFLDEIMDDYERIYKENIELKDKVNMLADQIRQYNTLEDTLKNTLILAQSTADELMANARQKSNNIVENAEIEGQKLIQVARDDVRNIKEEYENLKKEIFIFKTRYKSFVEAQLISVDEFYNNMEKKESKQDALVDSKKIEKDSSLEGIVDIYNLEA